MAIDSNAKRFLNAYNVLAKHEQEVQQLGVRRALEHNATNPGDKVDYIGDQADQHVMGVDFVCLAFAVELYLKAVFEALGISKRGHKFRDLFEELPENVQVELFDIHAQGRYGESLDTFKAQMDVISNGFEQFRYSHEHKSLNYHRGFAIQLTQSVEIWLSVKRQAKKKAT